MDVRQPFDQGAAPVRPLFILSFHHRDDLAGLASRCGWHPIAARRRDGAELRFIASDAMVALVDLRGAFDEGVMALRALSETISANSSALIALIDRSDRARLDAVHGAGATHYLAEPFGDEEFKLALRFAERHAERVSGGPLAVSRAKTIASEGQLSWEASLDGTAVRLSPSLATLLALPPELADIRLLVEAIAPDDRRAALSAFRRIRRVRQPSAFVHGLLAKPADRFVEHMHVDPVEGVIKGSIEHLDHQGQRDPFHSHDRLTGLSGATQARGWIAQAATDGQGLFLLLLALDRFEAINTSYGRATGDAVLQAVGRRIQPIARSFGGQAALVGRMAGAEFVIGVAGAFDPETAQSLARALSDACARPFLFSDGPFTLGCTIGGVFALPDEQSETTILRRASAALAEARYQDGASHLILTQADAEQVASNRDLQADLRRALEGDELEILFQPQVSVASGRIIGVEALARWQHPERGLLGAHMLLSAALEAGLMGSLSARIQQQALSLAAAWEPALSSIRLSVNITAEDLATEGFLTRFLALVKRTGFPVSRLTVEMTESGLIDDLAGAASLFGALRDAGCRVAIDDFGTGYSSLSYLKALPLDYLKIDKGLAADIAGSSRDRVVVRSVIDMGRSLGLSVIAEGVETEGQLGLLAQEGCNAYQGFLCAEPLSNQALAGFVSDWNDRH